MHGTRPTEDDWVHDGVRHVDLAEAYLRRAIKATIAKDNPALRRDIKIQRQVKSLRAEKARLLREARTPNARGSGQTSQGRARGLGREP